MVMGTALVGGLQAIAEALVEAEHELRELDSERMRIENKQNAARGRRNDAEKRLLERVGANVTTKVFNVGAEVVIVEHQRGVRLVGIEPRE